MFSVRVLPRSQRGSDGQRLGEITIGNFTEVFACYPVGESLVRMEARWQRQLRSLVEGELAVALIYDPGFAWIIYRGDPCCHVQQRFSLQGEFRDLLPHLTVNEDGQRLSEWTITLHAIEQFARA